MLLLVHDKAVIFDADGPLYGRTEEVTNLKIRLLHDFGYDGPFERFQELYEERKFLAYVGKETIAEMFRYILGELKVSLSSSAATDFAEKFNDIQSQVTVTAEAHKTLEALKQRGIKICVLTDSFYSSEEKAPWFNKIGLGQFIDEIVSSVDIKFLKDTPEAYQACLRLLTVKSDEAVFVGHQQYEMDGAKKARIISIAVEPIATPGIIADYIVGSISEVPALLTTF